ncbi:hypothetical protein CGZ93_14530 [Enemella dayhoffiae]|uniref:DUF4334 domain-containing protein n=1 Tax=Enemella dayhoffiae TaxID=2016507 RepID=A0A255GS31_9ACTN|nr:DUF4334 domain-containing protein [Enemella dayhoffiae]OYO18635.1 hypothetical protein CGZ93_14530 [Enemella dayhoffiae]
MSADRLSELEPTCTPQQALALFDALPSVRADELTGRWRGRELGTGHRLDGLLAASGWYGKQVDSAEDVHPLLFRTPRGRIFAGDPQRMPLGLAGVVPVPVVDRARRLLGAVEPALRTSRPRARLRNLEYRGVVSAAMIYDHLPIIDSFRRVGAETLLGAMDLRNQPRPYFFVLTRDADR